MQRQPFGVHQTLGVHRVGCFLGAIALVWVLYPFHILLRVLFAYLLVHLCTHPGALPCTASSCRGVRIFTTKCRLFVRDCKS